MRKFISIALLVCAMFRPFAKAQNTSSGGAIDEHALTSMVYSEMQELNKATGRSTRVTISDGGSSYSDPTNGIFISRQELLNINRSANARNIQNIVRLLLAHEQMHQVQFANNIYGPTAGGIYDPGIKKVFECQADILAGQYITVRLVNSPNEAFSEAAILDALDAMFSMGIHEFDQTTDHPSREERRTAVRTGMALGEIARFNATANNSSTSEEIRQKMVQSGTVLMHRIDLRSTENEFAYSLRVSKRIVQYDQQLRPDLILMSADTTWGIWQGHQQCSFDLAYKNIGNKNLDIDIEVELRSLSTRYPDDNVKSLKNDAGSKTFHIGPGETQHVTGSLLRDESATYDGTIPKLFFAPGPTTQISINANDFNERVRNAPRNTQSIAAAKNVEKNIPYLAQTIESMVLRKPSQLRGSVGWYDGLNYLYYCSIPLPGSISNTLYIPTDDPTNASLFSVYYEGYDPTKADALYQNLGDILRQNLAGWTSEANQKQGHKYITDKTVFTNTANSLTASISRQREIATNMTTVDISISWQ